MTVGRVAASRGRCRGASRLRRNSARRHLGRLSSGCFSPRWSSSLAATGGSR
jgi:hypothetical protein